jgi:hypothetical protein
MKTLGFGVEGWGSRAWERRCNVAEGETIWEVEREMVRGVEGVTMMMTVRRLNDSM